MAVLGLRAAGPAGLSVPAYAWAYRSLPPRHQLEPYMEWSTAWKDGLENCSGRIQAASYGFTAGLLASLFAARFLIIRWAGSPWSALAWFRVLLAVALPGVWVLVVFDGDDEWVSTAAVWVGDPVALLAVPTAFMCHDAATGCRLPPGRDAVRCHPEPVLVPVWAVAWFYFEFLGLGWVGA